MKILDILGKAITKRCRNNAEKNVRGEIVLVLYSSVS